MQDFPHTRWAWLQSTDFCPLPSQVPLIRLSFPLACRKPFRRQARLPASSSSLAAALREQAGLQEPSGQLQLPSMAASCGVGPVQPKRGVCPVVGRIRTCAGKPQWISSPSPSPLGHNYVLQPCWLLITYPVPRHLHPGTSAQGSSYKRVCEIASKITGKDISKSHI